MSCIFSVCARHTLWRCLQSTVTPVLASILEVIDRYSNLDLLSPERLSPGLVNLWMDILADSQILHLAPPTNTRYWPEVLPFTGHTKDPKPSITFPILFLCEQF